MKEHVTASDGQLVISLTEKLTFEDHNNFRDLLKHLSNDNFNSCTFDLKGLQAIDSAGLGMLMIAFETAEKSGISFQLSKPSGQVKRLLEISEFGKIMSISQ